MASLTALLDALPNALPQTLVTKLKEVENEADLLEKQVKEGADTLLQKEEAMQALCNDLVQAQTQADAATKETKEVSAQLQKMQKDKAVVDERVQELLRLLDESIAANEKLVSDQAKLHTDIAGLNKKLEGVQAKAIEDRSHVEASAELLKQSEDVIGSMRNEIADLQGHIEKLVEEKRNSEESSSQLQMERVAELEQEIAQRDQVVIPDLRQQLSTAKEQIDSHTTAADALREANERLQSLFLSVQEEREQARRQAEEQASITENHTATIAQLHHKLEQSHVAAESQQHLIEQCETEWEKQIQEMKSRVEENESAAAHEKELRESVSLTLQQEVARRSELEHTLQQEREAARREKEAAEVLALALRESSESARTEQEEVSMRLTVALRSLAKSQEELDLRQERIMSMTEELGVARLSAAEMRETLADTQSQLAKVMKDLSARDELVAETYEHQKQLRQSNEEAQQTIKLLTQEVVARNEEHMRLSEELAVTQFMLAEKASSIEDAVKVRETEAQTHQRELALVNASRSEVERAYETARQEIAQLLSERKRAAAEANTYHIEAEDRLEKLHQAKGSIDAAQAELQRFKQSQIAMQHTHQEQEARLVALQDELRAEVAKRSGAETGRIEAEQRVSELLSQIAVIRAEAGNASLLEAQLQALQADNRRIAEELSSVASRFSMADAAREEQYQRASQAELREFEVRGQLADLQCRYDSLHEQALALRAKGEGSERELMRLLEEERSLRQEAESEKRKATEDAALCDQALHSAQEALTRAVGETETVRHGAAQALQALEQQFLAEKHRFAEEAKRDLLHELENLRLSSDKTQQSMRQATEQKDELLLRYRALESEFSSVKEQLQEQEREVKAYKERMELLLQAEESLSRRCRELENDVTEARSGEADVIAHQRQALNEAEARCEQMTEELESMRSLQEAKAAAYLEAEMALKSEIEELRAAQARVELQFDEVRTKARVEAKEQAEEALHRLQIDVEAKCRELEELRSTLEEADAATAHATEMITELQHKLMIAQQAVADPSGMHEQLQVLQAAVEERTEENKRLAANILELTAECQQVREREQSKEEAFAALDADLKALQSAWERELAEKCNTAEALNARLEESEAVNKALRLELEKLQDEIVQAGGREEEIETLQARLEHSEREADEARMRLAEAEGERRAAQAADAAARAADAAEKMRLCEELEALTRERDVATKRAEELDAACLHATERLLQVEAAAACVEEARGKAEEQLAACEEALDKTEVAKDTLLQERNVMREEAVSERQKREAQTAEVDRLREQLEEQERAGCNQEALKEKIAATEKECQLWRDRATQGAEQLQAELSSIEETLNELLREKTEAVEALALKEKEVETLHRQYEEASSSLRRLDEERQCLAKVQQLSERQQAELMELKDCLARNRQREEESANDARRREKEMESRLREAESKRQEAAREITEREEQVRKAQAEAERLFVRLATAERELEERSSPADGSSAEELEDLRRLAAEREEEATSLATKYDSLIARNRQLEKRISSLEAQVKHWQRQAAGAGSPRRREPAAEAATSTIASRDKGEAEFAEAKSREAERDAASAPSMGARNLRTLAPSQQQAKPEAAPREEEAQKREERKRRLPTVSGQDRAQEEQPAAQLRGGKLPRVLSGAEAEAVAVAVAEADKENIGRSLANVGQGRSALPQPKAACKPPVLEKARQAQPQREDEREAQPPKAAAASGSNSGSDGKRTAARRKARESISAVGASRAEGEPECHVQ